jgi:hypothetical protein
METSKGGETFSRSWRDGIAWKMPMEKLWISWENHGKSMEIPDKS